MEAALRSLLIGHAPLTALVPAARIVWNHLPQDTPNPAIVLYRISGGPGIHMQGSDRLTNATVQIDVRAETVASMWAVRDALVALLHGYRGVQGTVSFRGIFLIGDRQDSDKPGTVLLHRSSTDWDVWSGLTA
ncbi:MAG: hypothetical protein JWQ89_2254 [Devosia sp.]|nr:hypothetical protein [Devosia sp.]